MTRMEGLGECLSCGGAELEGWIETPAHMHDQTETFSFSRCARCGLIQLDPRVAEEELGRYYGPAYLPFRGPAAWGRYAPLVSMSLARTDRRRVALALSGGGVGPQSRVLDVGCGKPTFLKMLRDRVGCYAKGIDLTDEGWRGEQERFAGLDLEAAEFHQVSITVPFDLITMWHYLEHDYRPLLTLRRMRQLAGAGTRLLVEVPDHASWPRLVQGRHWEGYHSPRHASIFTPRTLGELLERAGWKVERVRRFGTLDPYPLFWMGMQERRGIDWKESMERHFPGFMLGMLLTAPLFALKRWLPSGLMVATAAPAPSPGR